MSLCLCNYIWTRLCKVVFQQTQDKSLFGIDHAPSTTNVINRTSEIATYFRCFFLLCMFDQTFTRSLSLTSCMEFDHVYCICHNIYLKISQRFNTKLLMSHFSVQMYCSKNFQRKVSCCYNKIWKTLVQEKHQFLRFSAKRHCYLFCHSDIFCVS